MVRGLSPLARLDEMHPTLAKFSVPAGGRLGEGRGGSSGGEGDDDDGGGGGGGGGGGTTSATGGLSLSKAFETIEARKAELEVRRGGPGVGVLFFCCLVFLSVRERSPPTWAMLWYPIIAARLPVTHGWG